MKDRQYYIIEKRGDNPCNGCMGYIQHAKGFVDFRSINKYVGVKRQTSLCFCLYGVHVETQGRKITQTEALLSIL